MNLLVVDDDSIMRMLLRTLLTAEGYSVVTASDGEDALLKLTETPFDMVITDIYMPRMDGLRLRDTLRERQWKTLPILFISGYHDDCTTNAVLNRSLEGFFRKGRPLSELLHWVKYLRTPVAERSTVAPDGTMNNKVKQPPVDRNLHDRVQPPAS